MNLKLERMYYSGKSRPTDGTGFGGLFQQGFYINYLHGLDFLCRKHVTKATRVLELGCFYGASSELFREYSDDVTCIDIELFSEMDLLLKRTKIKFHKESSLVFLPNALVGEYDLIYIDTSHDFGQTKKEIELAYSKTNIGQIISGHDYNSPGVHNAILDVFDNPDIEIYLDSSWAIKKTDTLKLR